MKHPQKCFKQQFQWENASIYCRLLHLYLPIVLYVQLHEHISLISIDHFRILANHLEECLVTWHTVARPWSLRCIPHLTNPLFEMGLRPGAPSIQRNGCVQLRMSD